MSKPYAEGMHVEKMKRRKIPEGTQALLYELDENGERTGEMVLLTHEQYRTLMFGRKTIQIVAPEEENS